MKLTADDELVLSALREAARPMRARELSETTGLNYDRTIRSLRWLGRFGVLEKIDHHWHLTSGYMR